jgi:hypothetical protein
MVKRHILIGSANAARQAKTGKQKLISSGVAAHLDFK